MQSQADYKRMPKAGCQLCSLLCSRSMFSNPHNPPKPVGLRSRQIETQSAKGPGPWMKPPQVTKKRLEKRVKTNEKPGQL